MAESTSQVRHGDLVFSVRSAGPERGEAVILLHGFPQTPAMWSPYLARLGAAGFRAVAPAQRGYAATARPASVGQYTLDLLAEDVLAVADGLGIDTFHLVGHDWGGVVGWSLASSHPDRVRSWTSVSTPHPKAFASSLWRSAQLARSWYIGFFQVPQVPERLLTAANGLLLRRALRSSGLPGADADAYADAMVEPGAMAAALAYYRALHPGKALGIGRSNVPTLLVWGTEDVALGREAALSTKTEVEAPYRLEILEGASHWIPETRVDELTALLLDHLSSQATSTAA